MSAPQRIQRKRTAGWRMPDGAIYVGRPTKWGNPFTVMNAHRQGWLVWDDRHRYGLLSHPYSEGFIRAFGTQQEANAFAVQRYRRSLCSSRARVSDLTPLLRGRDLACWCPLLDGKGDPVPCHADVLLELANAPSHGGQPKEPRP